MPKVNKSRAVINNIRSNPNDPITLSVIEKKAEKVLSTLSTTDLMDGEACRLNLLKVGLKITAKELHIKRVGRIRKVLLAKRGVTLPATTYKVKQPPITKAKAIGSEKDHVANVVAAIKCMGVHQVQGIVMALAHLEN